MKRLLNLCIVSLFVVFAFFTKANADCTFEANNKTITFVEDELKFYENSVDTTRSSKSVSRL